MRRCSMRLPSSRWTSWKCTVLDSVAEYTFTGTGTRPKAIVPFQIERGAMVQGRYPVEPGVDTDLEAMDGRRRTAGPVRSRAGDRPRRPARLRPELRARPLRDVRLSGDHHAVEHGRRGHHG